MNEFSVYNTTFKFYNNDETRKNWNERDSYKHYKLFDDTMKFLGSIGFYVGKDKKIEKDFKCLSKDHRQGRYADLEFKARRYPAGFEIMFYQNVIFENRNGGEYDFDKLDKMPYLIKKQFELTIKKLSKFIELYAVCKTEPKYKYAVDKIKYNCVKSWHYPQKDMNFELSELDGDVSNYPYNSLDRDGKVIRNGDIKYFRDYNGYLQRGKVYRDINANYMVMVDNKNIRFVLAKELFDLTDDDLKFRRKKKHKPPKEYEIRKEQLAKATVKELENELKRRRSKE